MRIKLLDILVILAAASVTVFFSALAFRSGGGGGEVHITSEDGEAVYTLSREGEIGVHGPLGDTIVVISDGEARVVESPCRDKICIARGALDSAGEWTACLPNRVFVRVRSSGKSETDALSF